MGVPHTHHTHVRVGIRVITIAMGTYAQLLVACMHCSLCVGRAPFAHILPMALETTASSQQLSHPVFSVRVQEVYIMYRYLILYLINWQLNFYQLASASLIAERFTGL